MIESFNKIIVLKEVYSLYETKLVIKEDITTYRKS